MNLNGRIKWEVGWQMEGGTGSEERRARQRWGPRLIPRFCTWSLSCSISSRNHGGKGLRSSGIPSISQHKPSFFFCDCQSPENDGCPGTQHHCPRSLPSCLTMNSTLVVPTFSYSSRKRSPKVFSESTVKNIDPTLASTMRENSWTQNL